MRFTRLVLLVGIGSSAAAQEAPVSAPLLVVPADVELVSPEYVDPNGLRRRDPAQIVFDAAVTRVAVVGWRRGRPAGVAGDSVIDAFDYLGVAGVGPVGQPIRFRAGDRTGKRTEKWWVLADGKKVESEDWIGAIAASQDGQHVAYWRQPGAKIDETGAYSRGSVQLVFDGKPGAKWEDGDALSEPRFSRDGTKAAGVAMKGKDWFVVIASKQGETTFPGGFPWIGDVAWSPDGVGLAFAAADPTYQLRNPRTDRDRARGSTGEPSENCSIITGGGALKSARFRGTFVSCGAPVVSPDGKHVAYKCLARREVGAPALGIAVDGEVRIAPVANALGSPTWTPDGKHVAVAARISASDPSVADVHRDAELLAPDDHWFLLNDRDGVRSAEFERVADPVFTPNGIDLAFAARQDGKWRIVAGGTASEPFDSVGPPHFTSDGRHVCFGARRGREIRREVLALDSPEVPR